MRKLKSSELNVHPTVMSLLLVFALFSFVSTVYSQNRGLELARVTIETPNLNITQNIDKSCIIYNGYIPYYYLICNSFYNISISLCYSITFNRSIIINPKITQFNVILCNKKLIKPYTSLSLIPCIIIYILVFYRIYSTCFT